MEQSTLIFFVNGKKIVDNNVNPEWTLLEYLRLKLHLHGTKLGCGEGGCGACTVMISKINRETNVIRHYAVNSCLTPICSLHGLAVVTVEGIGSSKTKLHAVQEKLVKYHGSQCGFCTPGFVMSMYTLLRNKICPSVQDLDLTFQGNLCRCTGYRAIMDAYKTFTITELCSKGEKCCKYNNNKYNNNDLHDNSEELMNCEPIFPPELILNNNLDNEYLYFYSDKSDIKWFRPLKLDNLLDLKNIYPQAKILCGNTEIGVEIKLKNQFYPVFIYTNKIKELHTLEVLQNGVSIGASVSLSDLEKYLEEIIRTNKEFQVKTYFEILKMLKKFAGKQIRNVASVAGNILTASPISDLIPILIAAQATLEITSKSRGYIQTQLDQHFFKSYRKTIIKHDEVLVKVFIPFTKHNQYIYAFKQSRRRDDDISIVTAAFSITLESILNQISDIQCVYGGVAPVIQVASKTCKKLIRKVWNDDIFDIFCKNIFKEIQLENSAPGGMVPYRRCLIISLFFKVFLKISQQIETKKSENYLEDFSFIEPRSSQYYSINDFGAKSIVGSNIPHTSSFLQVTGEAIYCNDIPKIEDELYIAFALSSVANAELLQVNTELALKMPDVVACFTSSELSSNCNSFGTVVKDEQVFISNKISCQGQIIAAIVAKDQFTAKKAVKKIDIHYKNIQKPIVSIEDAIEKQSFFNGYPKILNHGNSYTELLKSPFKLRNECRTGAQEHFYLETQSVLVIPKNENKELEIFCSTQNPTEIQKMVSEMLEIPMNRITVRVKRIGGGFGGKESRSAVIALPAALAAYRLGKPIRCMLDRDEDMLMTGCRNPVLIKYNLGFRSDGRILACDTEIYLNSGFSLDLSDAVLTRAMLHIQNTYNIENITISGYLCKTNLPSNTAFRGFGGPQAMFAAECMIRDIADYLCKDYINVILINLYKENDLMPFKQRLTDCYIKPCIDQCLKMSNYENRLKEIHKFNNTSKWIKRGINLVPTMFGIAFTALFLNQAGALVHVYHDGSVLISHSGVEMGQGLHTKVIQIASECLNISIDKIHISETATDKVPNTSATAASVGSDLNGMAVLVKHPLWIWEELIKQAYFDRVSLSSTGFYQTPNIHYDLTNNSGNPFNYFTFGAACSEVEIDCLTGNHRVIRTDIAMDLGKSINPAIDIGQIEGAFTQGYGLFVMEEMVYSNQGILLTRGPGTYKIPSFGDVPLEFNVHILENLSNPKAVCSSKAVGEPPLFLASSVAFAIRHAIRMAQNEQKRKQMFYMSAPMTCAKIRMECHDEFTKMSHFLEDENQKEYNKVP